MNTDITNLLIDALEKLLSTGVCDFCYEDECGGITSCTKGKDGGPCQCHLKIEEAETNAYVVLKKAKEVKS